MFLSWICPDSRKNEKFEFLASRQTSDGLSPLHIAIALGLLTETDEGLNQIGSPQPSFLSECCFFVGGHFDTFFALIGSAVGGNDFILEIDGEGTGKGEEYLSRVFPDRPTIGTYSPAKTREFFTGGNTKILLMSKSNQHLV